MAFQSYNATGHEEEVSAAFMRNHRGAVCIAFADPLYVRAEKIIVDPANGDIHAVVYEASHFLGRVSEGMMHSFTENEKVLLTALRPDGTIFELGAPVHIREAVGA